MMDIQTRDTNEKVFRSIVIGLIIGLGIGAAASYWVFIPQLSGLQGYKTEAEKVPGLLQEITNLSMNKTSLQSQITDLQSQINLLANDKTNLQTQISDLQTQIHDLLPSYQKGTWNVLYTISGSDGFTTDYFYIPQTELRVNWQYTFSDGNPYLYLYLFKKGEQTYFWRDTSIETSPGFTYIHGIEQGTYFLDINKSLDIDSWKITIEVFVPA